MPRFVKSNFVMDIREAIRAGRLKNIFRPRDVEETCPGWAYNTYRVFLPKHRKGNPGGYTEYFIQHPDGSYSLRELFMLGEDYVSMVACQDEIDVALLDALREAGATGRQSGELATQLDIDHRHISRRIRRMNKRMEQEIGENIIEKYGHKWKLIPRLRRDFAVARGE